MPLYQGLDRFLPSLLRWCDPFVSLDSHWVSLHFPPTPRCWCSWRGLSPKESSFVLLLSWGTLVQESNVNLTQQRWAWI